MANIDQFIEQIENARYGKDVRQAIVSALEAMNEEIGTSGVTSFNSRTGAVTPAINDYNINQISAEGAHEGQVPMVNGNGAFTMRDIHGEIDALNQMDDVDISNPATGHVLRYTTSTAQWKNVKPLTVSAGSKESTSEGGVHLTLNASDNNVFNIRGIPIKQNGTQFDLYPSVLDSMPTAQGSMLGDNVLYIGETTASYTKGCVYKCVYENNTYKWINANIRGLINTVVGNGTKTYKTCLNELCNGMLDSSTNLYAITIISGLYVHILLGNSSGYFYTSYPHINSDDEFRTTIEYLNVYINENNTFVKKMLIYPFEDINNEITVITNNTFSIGDTMQLYKL